MTQPADYKNLSVRITQTSGKTIGVLVKAKKQIPQDVVDRAIQQLGSTFDKERGELILQEWDGKDITYKRDKVEHKVRLDEHPAKLPFEIVRVAPAEKKEFWTEYKRGFNYNPLWCILWLFWGIISVGLDIHKAKKESFGKLDLLFDCPLEQKPEAAIEVLETTRKVVEDELPDSPDRKKAIATLTSAVVNARLLLNCSRGGKLQDFTNFIKSQVHSATEDFPVVIPAGFYKEEEYHPVHVVLFTEKDPVTNTDTRHVRVFRLDIPTTAKIAPYDEYIILNEHQLNSFLETLVQKIAPKSAPEKEDPIVKSLIQLDALKQEPKAKLRTPSKDPWKLSSVLLKESVKGLPKIERDRFILQLMQSHVERMLPFADELDPEKRKVYFKGLEKQIERYEAKLSKRYGISFARNATKEIRAAISSYLTESEVIRQSQRQEAFEQTLAQATDRTDIKLGFKEPVRSLSAASSQGKEEGNDKTGIGSKLKALNEIDSLLQKPSLQKEDVNKVISNIEDCLNLGDERLNKGALRQAAQAASAILMRLPPYSKAKQVEENKEPNVDSIDDAEAIQYYDPLYQKFGKTDYDELLRLETQVGRAIRILGEANLRRTAPLMPEDFVYLQNAKAFLAQIQQRKKALLLLKMHKAIKTGAFEHNLKVANLINFIVKFNALSFKDQGALAKQLGLTRDECLVLATTEYMPELASMMRSSIVESPHSEIGYSLRAIEKLNNLPVVVMVKSPTIKNGKLVNQIDTSFGLFFELSDSGDSPNLFERSHDLLSGFGVDSKIEDCYGAIEIPEKNKESYLSSGAIYLRQAEIFTSAALHPETTVFLGFEGLKLGSTSLFDEAKRVVALTQAASWIKDKKTTAQKELGKEASPKEIQERVGELQLEDVRNRFEKMGKLELVVENSIITKAPCVMIRGKEVSDEAKKGFYFYANGLPATVPIPPDARPKENPTPFAHTSGALLSEIGNQKLMNPGMAIESGRGYIGMRPLDSLRTAQDQPRSDISQIELSLLYSLQGEDPTATMARLFRIIIEYPHLLDHEIARRRIAQVFFSQLYPYIEAGDFSHYRSQWIDLASRFQSFLADGQYHRAAYFLFLMQSLKKALGTKSVEEYQYLPLLTDFWNQLQNAKGTPQERPVAIYLLSAIDEAFIAKATANQLTEVLQAWEAFQMPGGLDFSPHLEAIVRDKMEISILPTLRAKVKSNTNLQEKVDLSILDSQKERVLKSLVSIPQDVKRTSLYKKLLGNADPKVRIITKGNKIDCRWTTGIRHFHLIFDPSKNKDTEQLVISFEEGGKKYFYSPATTRKEGSVALVIERQGVWTVKENNKISDAIVLLKQPFEYEPQESILTSPQTLKLTVKHNVIEEIKTGDGKKVCQDEKEVLSKEFPFLPKADAIFLTGEDGKGVKEVRPINAPFHFINKDGKWRVSDKPDWECHLIEEDSLKKELGENYTDCILVLTKGYQKEYRIFPKALMSIPVKGEPLLKFDTKAMSGPLSITQNALGLRTGSHAAFFYMAYLALAQGRTAGAMEWLKLAEKNGVQEEKDTDFLKDLLSKLSSLPASTMRSQACHLKFELTLRRALKEKYRVVEFEEPDQFGPQANRLVSLYRDYEKAAIDPSNQEILKAEGLLLFKEEKDYFTSLLKISAPVTILGYEARLNSQIKKLQGPKTPMPALPQADFTFDKWPIESINVSRYCRTYEAQETSDLADQIVSNREDALACFKDQTAAPADEALQMRVEQNRRVREGIKHAADERLKDLATYPYEIKKGAVSDFQHELINKVRKMKERMGILQKKILQIASDQSENLELGHLSFEAAKESTPVVMQRLLDLYQDGQIKDKIPDEEANELERLITEYLLLSAPVQMLNQAYSDPNMPCLSDLLNLDEKDPEWRIVSTEVLKKIKHATAYRYLGANRKLVNPEQQRAYLVLEHRAGYVLTEDQMQRVNEIEKDPRALEALRMGLGKSTVVFPMLARFIARGKQFPVVLFTEELIGQSRADMDRRAYEFMFDRGRNLDTSLLKQEYLTLLEVRKSHRYVMTTVDRLASLDNKMVELHFILSNVGRQIKEMKKKGSKFEEEIKTLEAEKLKIQEQLKWLKRISSIFDDEDTRFIADEADEIFNISSEKNYSEGKLQNVNFTVSQAGEKIFEVLTNPYHTEFEGFLGKIQNDHQTLLTPDELQNELLKIARRIAYDTAYWGDRGWNRTLFAAVNGEEFAKYLVGIGDRPRNLPEKWPTTQDPAELRRFQAIDSMRHWFIKTMPAILSKRSGLDYDLSKENGHSIVPKKEGRPLPGVKFGEEYELVGYAFLSSLRKPISQEVFKSIYPELKKASKDQFWFAAMLALAPKGKGEEAESESIYKLLLMKDKIVEREKVAAFLFQSTPLENVYAKQIRRNVQDVARRRKVAGVSGTMNTFALPHQFHPKDSTKYRSTTGDLLMRLSRMGQGLAEDLNTFDDPFTQIKEICKNPEYKAIINLGTVIGDKTTKETIAALRDSPEGKNRQFIFVDFVPVAPGSAKLKKVEMIWNPDEKNPKPFDKRRDAATVNPAICMYYFSAADTRGTDFRIPKGTAALIAGPTNDLSEWEQAAYRCRKLGVSQKMQMFVETSFANKLGSKTVRELVLAIRDQTVVREELTNYKYIATEPLAILRSNIEKVLFDPTIEGADEEALNNDFDVVEHLFIHDTTPKFGSDYDPAKKEDSLAFIAKTIDEQIDAAKELQKKLSSDKLSKAISDAIKELADRRAEVVKDWDEKFKPNLPAKLTKAVSVDSGAQAQVQQQAQQQTQRQQQQQQMQTTTVGKLRPTGQFENYPEQFMMQIIIDDRDMAPFSLKTLFPDCGLDDAYASTSMLSLLDNMAAVGSMSAYVGSFIAQDGKLRTILLSDLAQDLETAEIVKEKKHPDEPNTAKAVFSIAQDKEPELSTSVNWPPTILDEKAWKLQVAKLKLVMGMTQLPDDEKALLKDWFKILDKTKRQNLIAKLESRSSAQAAKMLNAWKLEAA